jgi:hypothetical protein
VYFFPSKTGTQSLVSNGRDHRREISHLSLEQPPIKSISVSTLESFIVNTSRHMPFNFLLATSMFSSLSSEPHVKALLDGRESFAGALAGLVADCMACCSIHWKCRVSACRIYCSCIAVKSSVPQGMFVCFDKEVGCV